jgi:ABC-type protease/lipase transport system fused ATPase/permease subunit
MNEAPSIYLKHPFWTATRLAAFSALINLLYLTGSFYMLQVYDRVIPSRSVPTLIALSLLAAALFAGQAALDYFRSRVLLQMARSLDERLHLRARPLGRADDLAGRLIEHTMIVCFQADADLLLYGCGCHD